MQNKGQTVKALVYKDLQDKLDAGLTVEQIKQVSLTNSAEYEANFRFNLGHLTKGPFKNSTVGRYLEQWIKSKS